MADHAAHASKITVGGQEYRVRRTFALICRIEERFGPIIELGKRLENAALTGREQVDLYKALLADCEDPPSDAALEDHLIRQGLIQVIAEVHPIVTSFFVGEDRFMKRVAEQAAGNGRAPDQRPGQASSTGAGFSEPPPDWDGVPPISGRQPFTN